MAATPVAPGAAWDPGPAFSAQLHVHGSFSEGIGSIDSHSREATDVGADVVWWSDHDFRIGSYRHVTRYGFEAAREPVDAGEAWRDADWFPRRGGDGPSKGIADGVRDAIGSASAEITAARADEGERSLALRVAAPPDAAGEAWVELRAARGLLKRPIASGIAIELAAWIDAGDPATALVEVALSEHPEDATGGFAQRRLLYRLGDPGAVATARPPRDAAVAIPIAVRRGAWNRVALPVSADAIAAFGDVLGRDNGMADVRLGIEVPPGEAGTVFFDSFAIAQEVAGDAAFARQRQVIAAVARRYPGLVELQGVEISYAGQHLNEFSMAPVLPDYDALLRDFVAEKLPAGRRPGGRGEAVARRAVDAAHRRGGLVSYNHMFGTREEADVEPAATRDQVLERVLREGAFGADLLEVGYRDRGGHDLADHLWVWDQLALRGLPLVGVGVSDSHGGPAQRWRTAPNNFVSWIYAPSAAKADLIEGLRRGRVFFGDITRFDGRLDLATDRGQRMGAIVVSDRSRVDVSLLVEGAREGDRVEFVEPSGRTEAGVAAGGEAQLFRRRVVLPADGPWLVRAELRAPSGEEKALSNAIVFVRRVPEHDRLAARVVVDGDAPEPSAAP